MNEPKVGNYIKISRQMVEWRFWYSEIAVKLWIILLLKANWRDGWFMGTKIPRGSLATSMRNLAEECGVSEKTIKKWLNRFEEDGQIVRSGTNRYTLITLINYGFYQDVPEEWYQQSTQQDTQQRYQQDTQQSTEQGYHNRRRIRKKEEREEESDALTLFSDFRTLYPVKTSKEKLETAYRQALEDGATEEQLLDALQRWKDLQWDRWPDGEKRFIPGPVKWLTECRWQQTVTEYRPREKKKKADVLPNYYDPDPNRKGSGEKMTAEERSRLRALLDATKTKGKS